MPAHRGFFDGYLRPNLLPMVGFFLLFMMHFFAGMRGGLAAALLVLLMLAARPVARAQAPAWQMAMAVSGNQGLLTTVQALAADANGNIYLAGGFEGTISLSNLGLTSVGGRDVFVAKWNQASRRFVWAQRAGGIGDDYATVLAVNGTSLYVTGEFTSNNAFFGNSIVLNSNPGSDVFVTKLTDAGQTATFTWAKSVNGQYIEKAAGICCAGTSVYITGSFSSPGVMFGSLATLSYTGGYDVFIAKLEDSGSTGDFIWARRAGGADDDFASAIALNGTTLYLAGSFQATASFGAFSVISAGSSDVFTTKLTDDGNSPRWMWVQQTGGADFDEATALAVNGANVYVAGNFNSGQIDFGSTSLANLQAGNPDVFVAKLTDTGTASHFTWALRAGGPAGDYAQSMSVSGTGVFVAGSFLSASAAFGTTILANTGGGADDIFITKLIDAGSMAGFSWTQQSGGIRSDGGRAVVTSGTDVVVAGYISPPVSFRPYSIVGPIGIQTGFLASLTDATLTATAAAQGTLPFTLAPNPACASTTVQLPALPGMATATLILLDALGRMVRTTTVALPPAGLRHEFSLAGLAPGLYALRVHVGDATSVRRLVVE